MNIVTAEQMRDIDRRAMDEFSIPGIVLMENAGLRVVETIRTFFPGRRVVVLAGRGNNGGDGLVVTRHLRKERDVSLWLLASPEEYRNDALTNLTILQRLGHPYKILDKEDGLADLQTDLAGADVIVDALLGTGIARQVSALYAGVIRLVNSINAPVVAVDMPSGICADTGRVMGEAVRASLTVTFGLPKRGLLLFPGAAHTGRLEVADIGIPSQLLSGYGMSLLTPSIVQNFLPSRRSDGHKRTFGSVLLVAGSIGMSGAAVLCARAALRGGAGLVTVASPRSVQPVVAGMLAETMTMPLPEDGQGWLHADALPLLRKKWAACDALAVGPGLAHNEETLPVLAGILQECPLPVVLDADALNLLALAPQILKERSRDTVLTPHPGEAARLLNCSVTEVEADRPSAVRQLAAYYRSTVVLKGAHTLIAGVDDTVCLNVTGNSGMATAGSGDVLTGLITALLAQGLSVSAAAKLAVYLHGLAGDLAASVKGEEGVIAGDLTEFIPQAYLELQKIHI